MADSTDEDRWASLAADLGVDGSTPTTQADPAAPADGPPKKRRRRRPRKAAPADGAIAEPVDEASSEPDDAPEPELTDREELSADGTPKKRRRRRSRRKPDEANGDVAVATDAVAVAEVGDDDDDAAEPVSVANLPSWQELIDGLHRP